VTTWTYGDEGVMFDVKPGEVWQAGQHRFVCSDLMESDQFDEFVNYSTLVYTDPPYTQAMITGYRTKAGLGRGDYKLLDLYGRLLGLAGNRPCYLEGGLSVTDQVWHFIQERSEGCARWPITYDRNKPSVLYYAGPPPPKMTLSNLDDLDIPELVLRTYGHGVVADCCAGRGLTAVSAERAGWMSVNNELHPNRMSAALARLAAMGSTVERISS